MPYRHKQSMLVITDEKYSGLSQGGKVNYENVTPPVDTQDSVDEKKEI